MFTELIQILKKSHNWMFICYCLEQWKVGSNVFKKKEEKGQKGGEGGRSPYL